VRRLLQALGTEGGRHVFGPDVWVDELFDRVRESSADVVIVTDVRFHNEFYRIHDYGGSVCLVNRREADAVVDNHESERDWRDLEPDFLVYNNQGLNYLSTVAHDIASRISVPLGLGHYI